MLIRSCSMSVLCGIVLLGSFGCSAGRSAYTTGKRVDGTTQSLWTPPSMRPQSSIADYNPQFSQQPFATGNLQHPMNVVSASATPNWTPQNDGQTDFFQSNTPAQQATFRPGSGLKQFWQTTFQGSKNPLYPAGQTC